VVEVRTVGPTLGLDSLQKSLQAGMIGFTIVILFMLLYYRLPGAIADIAIIIYAIIAFALFRFIPVTLTLAGIAGFLLSTGSALDANILIFERMKEEVRAGKNLLQASDIGWQRAWPSIRDSNIATLITCAILFWFGSSFGATIVKGFSLTLALGVIISLFTAILVTRSLLRLILNYWKPTDLNRWLGL
jgi:preprotein translocase subunit SecD